MKNALWKLPAMIGILLGLAGYVLFLIAAFAPGANDEAWEAVAYFFFGMMLHLAGTVFFLTDSILTLVRLKRSRRKGADVLLAISAFLYLPVFLFALYVDSSLLTLWLVFSVVETVLVLWSAIRSFKRAG